MNDKSEDKINENNYKQKVDIAPYFGYGGHEMIATKLVSDNIYYHIKNFGDYLCNTYNNMPPIKRDDIFKALHKHSDYKDIFDEEYYN